MATNLVATSKIFIDSATQGHKYLKDCKVHNESDDADVELAHAAGEDVAVGYTHKKGGGSFDLEVYRTQGAAPLVNFHKLQALRETFVMTRRDTGGQAFQYGGCRVANVAGDSDEGGVHMTKVKLIWATREAL